MFSISIYFQTEMFHFELMHKENENRLFIPTIIEHRQRSKTGI